MFGGELDPYTDLMTDCSQIAIRRLSDSAIALGATFVVNIRFDSTATMNR